MINVAITEIWQSYQGPEQIKLEIDASPIQPSGGGEGVGRRVNSEKLDKMRYS